MELLSKEFRFLFQYFKKQGSQKNALSTIWNEFFHHPCTTSFNKILFNWQWVEMNSPTSDNGGKEGWEARSKRQFKDFQRVLIAPSQDWV